MKLYLLFSRVSVNYGIRIISFLIFFLVLLSCEDEKSGPEYPKFTASFINNWLSEDAGEGILFISDMDGNYLGGHTWSGDATFDVYPNTDKNFPDKIWVTTVTSSGNYIFITSNISVTPSDWTWKGYPQSPDYLGDATLSFNNIPNDSRRYYLTSQWYSRAGYSDYLNSPFYYPLRENSSQIYFSLIDYDNNSGYYQSLENVTVNSNHTVDYDSMLTLNSKSIGLPASNYNTYLSLYGYSSAGDYYSGQYRLHYYYYEDNINDIAAYYPDNIPEFRTFMRVSNNDYSTIWYNSVYGDIPDSFEEIDGFIQVEDSNPANFSVETIGNFDEIISRWDFVDDSLYYRWSVYGPSDLFEYMLPQLPPLLTSKYGNISRSDFEVQQTEIIDQLHLDSYEEIINTLFKTDEYFYNATNGGGYRIRIESYDSEFRSLDRNNFSEQMMNDGQYH